MNSFKMVSSAKAKQPLKALRTSRCLPNLNKLKVNLLLIALALSFNSCAQDSFDKNKISKRTMKVVKEISKVNELMSSAVYYSGIKPKQWDHFEELKSNTSKEELLELTNHPNGVVRCYAFWALSFDKSVNLFPIVKKHLTDDELIDTQFGCIGEQKKVGDFFIQLMTPQFIDPESNKLSEGEANELDSLLIYQPNNLSSKYDAISRAEITERLYPKIRELLIKEKNPSALIALAKYQKVQDIDLIKYYKEESDKTEDGFYFTYAAIKEFPSPEFLPFLEKNLKKTLDNTHFSTEWRELYMAIASFKNEKAVELLKIPFTQVQHQHIRPYHIEFVFEAILAFQDSIYDELLWQIWEEENQTSIDSYKYLLSINPRKAYELTKKELIEGYEVHNSEFIPDLNKVEDSENYYEFLLNVIRANDKELSNKIIAQQIEKANVHILPIFTSKVYGEEIFKEPLFNRLENASNPHIYLNLIETLIEYKDENINQRIVEVRKRNANLNKDWGGKALDKLLEENDIK
ncbi:MAG: hypothetical protein R2879_04655 [Saprospiraceae bacterium]